MRTRFRLLREGERTFIEVWVDNVGWQPASSQDAPHWEAEPKEQIEFDIPEKEGKK